jgi:hypothetical protein
MALLLFDLRAHLVFARLQLRREFGAEILGLVRRADLDLGLFAGIGSGSASPTPRLHPVLDLPEPVTRDELLGLGERAVDDGLGSAAAAETHAFAALLGLRPSPDCMIPAATSFSL